MNWLTAAMSLLVIGELNPDIIVAGVAVASESLRFGQAEDLVASTHVTLGSSGGITACAAARGDVPVRLVAVVGDDVLGRMCVQVLQDRRVDTGAVRVAAGMETGSSVILVKADDATDRHILTSLGAMRDLSADDIADGILVGGRHVHISSFFMHVGVRERLAERLRFARSCGATTSLDTNDDPQRTWDSGAQAVIGESDLLFCTDEEALGLAHLSADEDPRVAVSTLLDRMPPTSSSDFELPAVVHKMGAAGARVTTRSGSVVVRAPQVDVVDTIGAGDTLAGTVLGALLSGCDWSAALARGVAAASLSTTATGGVEGQASRQEVETLAGTLQVTG